MRNALLLLLALLAPLPAQPDRLGLPACAGPDRELAPKHSFIVCHSASFKAPLWAAHELIPSRLLSPVSTRRAHFRRDYSLPMPGASVAGYRSTGFSRGHLVPPVTWLTMKRRCAIRSW